METPVELENKPLSLWSGACVMMSDLPGYTEASEEAKLPINRWVILCEILEKSKTCSGCRECRWQTGPCTRILTSPTRAEGTSIIYWTKEVDKARIEMNKAVKKMAVFLIT